MDDIKNVEKWVLDDGRRAEKRVTETKNCEDGQGERIVELHVEDERPLRLQQRIREKTKPIVYERTIETVDPKTGEVVEQKLESIDPKVQMQLVEHISTTGPSVVSAQSVEDDCDCHVTKEEMIETIVAAIKTVKADMQPQVMAQSVPAARRVTKAPRRAAVEANDFSDRLNSLGLADEIEKRVDISGYSTSDKFLLLVIAAQVVGLGYIVFLM